MAAAAAASPWWPCDGAGLGLVAWGLWLAGKPRKHRGRKRIHEASDESCVRRGQSGAPPHPRAAPGEARTRRGTAGQHGGREGAGRRKQSDQIASRGGGCRRVGGGRAPSRCRRARGRRSAQGAGGTRRGGRGECCGARMRAQQGGAEGCAPTGSPMPAAAPPGAQARSRGPHDCRAQERGRGGPGLAGRAAGAARRGRSIQQPAQPAARGEQQQQPRGGAQPQQRHVQPRAARAAAA
ncbi:MAG: hypothetical protein J3K34DRAFT_426373, partial [Monoraphidium minutum]